MATAPHPTLEKHYRRPEDRQEYVAELFDTAAPHYAWICQVMSLGSGQFWRKQALKRIGLGPGMRVLDVATGTGQVARVAAELVGDPNAVTGLDPSVGMLAQARETVRGPLVQGRGEALPFASERFDVVSMGYALRHVPDLVAAFREYHRVLKPGGRTLILEISRPEWRPAYLAARFYLRTAIPFVTRLGTGSAPAVRLMEYYWDTIEHCVAPEVILDALTQAGFVARRRVFSALLSEYEGTRPT